ncbi:YhcN/YlaJ family sporulation lipoprotein [Peribacillus loiseleuriae]|uniref:YhcN/YlaJ family sporulation lipoprotein n=1 Tax=Peribacillus loiseleuriae TaxID=1679170 RepID=UPI001FE0712E|nr:YhcN/YlaJ family sporulation lipoprotein [Peribacillus loiseleuriae]
MQKKIHVLLCVVLLAGLIGCSANNQAGGKNQEDVLNTGGHYTNEKDSLVRQITYQAPIGQVVHDYSEANRIQENLQKNGENPTIPRSEYGNGLLFQERISSPKDRNYHGHITQLRTKSSYYNAYEGTLVDAIMKQANKVDHVKESCAIVRDKELIVTLLLDDYSRDAAIAAKQEVTSRVQPMAGNRTLYVLTDQGVYYRTTVLDNKLRGGGPKEQVILNVENMMETLGVHEHHLE